MTDALNLTTDYPQAWASHPGLPLLADGPWHQVMGGRFQGDPVWLWTSSDNREGLDVGMAGYVIEKPASYLWSDALQLVAAPESPFVTDEVARELARSSTDTESFFPYLLLTYPGYATFPVGHRSGDRAAVREALSAIVKWARTQGLKGIAFPYTEYGSELACVAAELGAVGPVITQESQLAVPAAGFAAYLEALPSTHRRKIRAERRKLHDRGVMGRRVDHITGALLERLSDLRCKHRVKYGLPVDAAAEHARLTNTVEALAGRVDIFTAGLDDDGGEPTIFSFGLFVRDGSTWHAIYTGNEYADARSATAYFEAVYYAPVETASAYGIDRISFGLAADRAKRLRGCTSEPIECLLLGLTEGAARTAAAIDAAWRQASRDLGKLRTDESRGDHR